MVPLNINSCQPRSILLTQEPTRATVLRPSGCTDWTFLTYTVFEMYIRSSNCDIAVTEIDFGLHDAIL